MPTGEYGGGDLCGKLRRHERSYRKLAGRLDTLEFEVRRLHPDSMTPQDWFSLRTILIDRLVSYRQRSIETADLLRDFREVFDEHRDPGRRNPAQT